jgi:hypothetical protein
MSRETLSAETGILKERLEALEEGDSATFDEVLWLSHVLQISGAIAPEFQISTDAQPQLRSLHPGFV